MNKIEVQNLSKSYRERRQKRTGGRNAAFQEIVTVLDHINFKIKTGSFSCILGPSGCGKSTLLRIIAGFDKPTTGKVLIDNKEVTGPSAKHIFVFQEDGLFPWMTAYQNVALGARHIKDKQKLQHEVEEYLDMVGLKGFENYYPYQLSGGMRRRAEVARALITNPDLLFMDEPFGALDFMTRLQMREEMINVHTMFETTILFITHDIDEALQLGDQIIVLGEKPASIRADIAVDFPHPRDFSNKEFSELRNKIYFLMGIHAAL